MKRLFLNIALLIILVAAGNWLVDRYFYNKRLPYYWGDTTLLQKRIYLTKNKATINTLFLGSSKTHYQIEPLVFDSIVNKNTGMAVHSYNFGIDAMLPPESFYIYEELLKNESLSFKTVILELDFLQTGSIVNLFDWRSYYWINKTTYNDYSQILLSSNFSSTMKAFNISLLNIKAVEKLSNIGKFNEYAQYRNLIREVTINDTSSENATAGFRGLPQWKTYTPDLLDRMGHIKSQTKNASSNYEEWSNGQLNRDYVNEINKIVAISKARGINLIFLIPVQWTVPQYKELAPIIKSIPEKNRIVMFGYDNHKELFEPSNLFDDNHVNKFGAKKYTGYVAQEFIRISKMK